MGTPRSVATGVHRSTSSVGLSIATRRRPFAPALLQCSPPLLEAPGVLGGALASAREECDPAVDASINLLGVRRALVARPARRPARARRALRAGRPRPELHGAQGDRGRAASGSDRDRVPAARRAHGQSWPGDHQRPAARAHLGRGRGTLRRHATSSRGCAASSGTAPATPGTSSTSRASATAWPSRRGSGGGVNTAVSTQPS